MFAALRNQIVATATGGTTTSVTAVRIGLVTNMNVIVPAKTRPLITNITRPWDSSCWIASMSAVIRETTTPVFPFSKKSSDSEVMWSKTRLRRSRRKLSPIQATP